jgi:hypothetical protein
MDSDWNNYRDVLHLIRRISGGLRPNEACHFSQYRQVAAASGWSPALGLESWPFLYKKVEDNFKFTGIGTSPAPNQQASYAAYGRGIRGCSG